jgi:hypothetical protein
MKSREHTLGVRRAVESTESWTSTSGSSSGSRVTNGWSSGNSVGKGDLEQPLEHQDTVP